MDYYGDTDKVGSWIQTGILEKLHAAMPSFYISLYYNRERGWGLNIIVLSVTVTVIVIALVAVIVLVTLIVILIVILIVMAELRDPNNDAAKDSCSVI